MPSRWSGMPPVPLSAALRGDLVALEPLRRDHVDALEAAAADGDLWQLGYASVPAPGKMEAYVDMALQGHAGGAMLPFVVRELKHGEIVGSTRYYEINPDLPRVAIGYTWYAQRWQRTYVNSACKLLLLKYAFSTLDCVAVAFHTDVLNEASQLAIARLGAKREGLLRAHKRRTDGSIRDTVCFSMLAAEWPAAREVLQRRLERLAKRV